VISLDRLIDALGITDQATVPRLEEQRDAALAFIQTQTRRYFGPIASTTDILAGSGTRSLWLPESAVVAEPLTITVQEFAHPGASPTAIVEDASDGFQLRGARLIRLGGSGLWTRGYEYAVTYSRGYEENAGPKDVEDLLIELVRLKVNADGEEVMKSETIGGYSYTRFDDGDLESIDGASDTIKAWRRLVFA